MKIAKKARKVHYSEAGWDSSDRSVIRRIFNERSCLDRVPRRLWITPRLRPDVFVRKPLVNNNLRNPRECFGALLNEASYAIFLDEFDGAKRRTNLIL